MRHLGIDYGTHEVGLALSDEAGVMGFPYRTLRNSERIVEEIAALVEQERVQRIVIGESRDGSGVENAAGIAARAFGDLLAVRTNLPVAYELEAFTTQEARRDIEGARKVTGRVDDRAAALILTSYLSRPHD